MGIDFNNLVLGPCMSAFADDVTWTPAGGSAVEGLRGVFGDSHVETDIGNEAAVSTTEPTLGIRLSEWPAAPEPDDTVTVKGTTYEIYDTQPDGEGGLILILKVDA